MSIKGYELLYLLNYVNSFTTIQITKQTLQDLKQILRKSETYDQGLCRILEEWNEKN